MLALECCQQTLVCSHTISNLYACIEEPYKLLLALLRQSSVWPGCDREDIFISLYVHVHVAIIKMVPLKTDSRWSPLLLNVYTSWIFGLVFIIAY